MEGDLMRKFLKVTAIVGLALLVAAPAMALDFKFGAEYRVRFYSNLNGAQATLGNDEGTTSARGVQIRIRPRFDVSDDNGNITATLRLEIGDIEWGNGGGAAGTANGNFSGSIPYSGARVGNGSGGAIGVDGVNVETKWAYMDFATPWGVPLRWRAGLQPWYESKGILVDDDVAGVRAYGKAGIVSYEVGWYRASGGPCTSTPPAGAAGACATTNTTDNNFDFYEGKVGFNFAKWLNPSLYYIYGYNAATNTTSNANVNYQTKPATSQFAGLAVTGDFGFLRYDFDFVAGTSNGGIQGNYVGSSTAAINGGDGRELTQGWMMDGGVHIPVGPLLFHVVGSYATGDKQNGGNSEAMPWISPSWNGAGGLYEIIGSGGTFDQVDVTQDYPAGLWMLGFGAEYRPVKALWMRAMYGYAGFVSKRSNCAYNNGSVIGSCYGAVYQGKGYTAPTVDAATGVVTAGGEGGMAGESILGHELSFRADYDLWTNFKVQGAAGWLFVPTGSTVQEYVLQLLYSF
jgi:hypothetical protein